jgi:hypothetical protein
VEPRDVLEAERQYSQFAVDSILVENGITISQLETVLYEFAGASAILDHTQLIKIMAIAGIDESKQESVIKHLCNLTFIGVEVGEDEYRFADDMAEMLKNTALAQRLVNARAQTARYRINPAFWSFLPHARLEGQIWRRLHRRVQRTWIDSRGGVARRRW